MNNLEEKGYFKEEIIKMTKTLSKILSYGTDSINEKIKYLESLEYTKEEIIKMTKLYPSLYSLSIDKIGERYKGLLSKYTKEEVMIITKDFPQFYGISTSDFERKTDYYDSIGLHKMIVEKPKYLMQSFDKTYARYCYYQDIEINIDMSNYRKLFIGEKQFEKMSKVSSQELIEKYCYKEEKIK